LTVESILKGFEQTKVLVVGDVMLDTYLWGSIDRISPEAPVPVVNINREVSRLGGAANVILNIKSLGAKPFICSVIGNDSEGQQLTKLLVDEAISPDYLIKDKSRPTTKKTRIISRNQQILRFDNEAVHNLSKETEQAILQKLRFIIDTESIDVLILQDYNKGLLSKNLITAIIDICREKNIYTVVDPKKENFFDYKDVTLFKPNLKEISQALNISINKENEEELISAANKIKMNLNNKYTLITLSEKGVFITNHNESYTIPSAVRYVSDVSGAGDTVVAVAALCLVQKVDLKTLAALSNMAGGIVCEDVGVVPINKARFEKEARLLIK